MIRDQAQKTVDIYIARIRKYASTMPDSVLPSPGLTQTGTAAPRMSTPSNDSTWTGWAISSFTNKLAAASGQMQATGTNGTSDQRSVSVPPPAVPTASKPTLAASTRPGMTLTKSAASIPTITSPDPAASFDDEAEDFDGDWGGFGDDGDGGPGATASKKDEDHDPWGTPNVATPSATKTNFDDKGEPDFAGWLAAQSQSKKPAGKPLPKGLAKTGAAAAKKPIVGGRTVSATRKVVVPPKKEVKKEEVKSNEDEEDGWGDAW